VALIAAAVLLLLAGGGAAWWFLRPAPEQPPQQQAAAPTPPPAPASPDCAEAGDVLSGKCGPEKLRALPPAEQTRLAEALLRLGGERRAGDMAVVLLGTAANANHPQARLALGRLYDPISFREGGPLRAANPERALDEYARAAEAGLAEARTAREALVARLRQEAAGTDPAIADRAKAALRAAGLE
jgi:TPR repeat protein